MHKALFVACLLLHQLCWANATDKPLKGVLDKLTIEEAIRLINKLQPNSYLVSIDSTDSVFLPGSNDIRVQKIYEFLQIHPLVKADFNRDGYTDLLITAQKVPYLASFCVLGGNDTNYRIINLNRGFLPQSFNAEILHRGYSDPMIVVTHVNQSRNAVKFEEGLPGTTRDTLAYALDELIEYHSKDTSYEIEKIEYRTTHCEGECPVFSITIEPNHSAVYNAITGNMSTILNREVTGVYHFYLRDRDYAKIISLLNYMDFPSLANRYNVRWIDDQISILTITYNNGQIKTVEDYGSKGTYGLEAVYRQLWRLRDFVVWNR